jgi:hypothetical protein
MSRILLQKKYPISFIFAVKTKKYLTGIKADKGWI